MPERSSRQLNSLYTHAKHPHQPINVNDAHEDMLSIGDRVADSVAATVGSWRFILIQSFILAIWLILNITGIVFRWDPYPFILLNLALSFQAAYAAPFVMMSQNRQSAKDRLMAENDYTTNLKSEVEIRGMIEHLTEQDKELLKQTTILVSLESEKIQRILDILEFRAASTLTTGAHPLPEPGGGEGK